MNDVMNDSQSSQSSVTHTTSYCMHTGRVFPELKCPEHESDRSLSSSPEVKNEWSCTSTITYSIMIWKWTFLHLSFLRVIKFYQNQNLQDTCQKLRKDSVPKRYLEYREETCVFNITNNTHLGLLTIVELLVYMYVYILWCRRIFFPSTKRKLYLCLGLKN